jgi:hypothetical protein
MHGLLACGLLLGAARGLAHGRASIDAHMLRRGDGAELRLRLSLRDLGHLVDVDRDGDGQLTPAEVLGVQAELERELRQALRLVPEPGWAACTSTLSALRLADLASVDVALRFRCGQALQEAELHSGLFAASGHDYTMTVRLDDAAEPVVLSREHNRVTLATPAARWGLGWLWAGAAAALATALGLGWRWRGARRR